MKIVKIPFVNDFRKETGCKNSHDNVIEELKKINSNSFGKEINFKNLEIGKMKLTGDISKDNELIYRSSFNLFKEKVLFLGGDHSLSYSLSRSFFDYTQNKGKEPYLIIFDSRPNLMNQENSSIPKNNGWLRSLVNDGFKKENILIVGVRNIHSQEKKFMEGKIRKITIEDLMFNLEDKTDSIMELSNGRDLYVSVDISCVDPSFAPGINHPESGGISSRELIYILRRISRMKNFRVLDMVELNSFKDRNGITAQLVAKLLSEFL